MWGDGEGRGGPQNTPSVDLPLGSGGASLRRKGGGSAAGKLDLLGEQGWRWAPRSALWGNLQGT